MLRFNDSLGELTEPYRVALVAEIYDNGRITNITQRGKVHAVKCGEDQAQPS